MDNNNSAGSGAMVAIIAILAILAIGYVVLQTMKQSDLPSNRPVIDVNINSSTPQKAY